MSHKKEQLFHKSFPFLLYYLLPPLLLWLESCRNFPPETSCSAHILEMTPGSSAKSAFVGSPSPAVGLHDPERHSEMGRNGESVFSGRLRRTQTRLRYGW
jgi:hypothetical protein